MKFFHLSDLHLGRRIYEFSLIDDQKYILKEILRRTDEERPDAVVIAGDIYDRAVPSAEAVELFDSFLTELAGRHIPVLAIAGNHDSPERIAVTINKQNYTHHVVKQTGVMNLNCLSTESGFDVFERFGFHTGRTVDKFAGYEAFRSGNGLYFLPRGINAFMSLKVEQYVDLGTHGMFICSVTEARVMSNQETMTYTYYQNNVKPKPETEGKKGFVCKVCGYIYEGDELPADYICPLCKHGAADFEPIG